MSCEKEKKEGGNIRQVESVDDAFGDFVASMTEAYKASLAVGREIEADWKNKIEGETK